MSTEEKKKAFIAALGEHAGSVAESCRAIGISRNAYYKWRKKDPGFAGQCDEIINLFKTGEEFATSVRQRAGKTVSESPTTYAPNPEEIFARYTGQPADRIRADLEKRIKGAMEAAGTYRPEYMQAIRAAATQGALLSMAYAEIDRLSFLQTEYTSGGSAKLAINPAYAQVSRLAAEYQRALRALGLLPDPKENRDRDTLGSFLDSINRDSDD